MPRPSGHNLKKALAALALLMITAAAATANPSGAERIDVASDFYGTFDTVARLVGYTPNADRPWTRAEAARYLEKVEDLGVPEAAGPLLDELREETTWTEADDETVFNFDLSGSLNPQLFAHTNSAFSDQEIIYGKEEGTNETIIEPGSYTWDPWNLYSSWGGQEVLDFAQIDLSIGVMDSVNLFFSLPVANVKHTKVPFGSQNVMSNIPMLASFTSLQYEDFNMNFPYRAHLAAGGDWWSLLIGRERLSYGSGVTGNFVIDSHLDYHNALTFSFFSDTVKYSFLASFFPHPSQYLAESDSNKDGLWETGLIFDQNQNAFTGTKMFMSHRLEFIMAGGRQRFAVTEGVTYQSDDGILDLQVLNPMMFFHNLYIAGNSNSILSFEYDVQLGGGFTFDAAIVVDDLNIPGERENDGENAKPDAVGLQLGLKSAHVVGDGILTGALELTGTSDYLYLYLREDRNSSQWRYPIDHIVAVRNMRSGTGVYDLTPMGYPLGGGAFNAHLEMAWQAPSSWSAGFWFDYILQGGISILSRLTEQQELDYDKPREHTFNLGLWGEWEIGDSMTIRPQGSWMHVINPGNEEGRETDFQFALTFRRFF